jgi:hypothetical protein
VRTRLFELQKEYIIKLADAVIATKSADGQVQLHQVVNTTASGAVSGTFWGLLIGILFLNPLLGAAAGAAGGSPIRPRRRQAFRPDPAPLPSHQGGPAALMDGWRRASHVSFKG